jgi:hypothetical protein
MPCPPDDDKTNPKSFHSVIMYSLPFTSLPFAVWEKSIVHLTQNSGVGLGAGFGTGIGVTGAGVGVTGAAIGVNGAGVGVAGAGVGVTGTGVWMSV